MRNEYRWRMEVFKAIAGVIIICILAFGLSWLVQMKLPDSQIPPIVIGIAGCAAAGVACWLCFRSLQSEQNLTEKLQRLSELHYFIKIVSSTLDINDVLDNTLKHTLKVLNADGGMIRYFGDGASSEGDIALVNGAPETTALQIIDSLRVTTNSDDVVVVNSYKNLIKTLGSELTLIDGLSPCSQFAHAKIIWDGRVLGGIVVWSKKHSFNWEKVNLFKAITVAVAEAVSNASAYHNARNIAERDSVTGLYNHRAVFQKLDFEIKRARRTNEPLSIVMIDINNFKNINDTYGHPVGDDVLRCTAKRLSDLSRETDIIARYGGDEFMAVLPNTTLQDANVLIERVRNIIANDGCSINHNGMAISYNLSFGISEAPTDGFDMSSLI